MYRNPWIAVAEQKSTSCLSLMEVSRRIFRFGVIAPK